MDAPLIFQHQEVPLEDVDGKFRLNAGIGSGGFGEVYSGIAYSTGKEVAAKLELSDTANPKLPGEYKLYRLLQGGEGFPRVHHYWESGRYNVLVMDRLGPSLEDCFRYCDRRFTMKTVLTLGLQMLNRLEYLHSKGYIHRDIKPENFLMDKDSTTNKVHMIDMGLAKRFRYSFNSRVRIHIKKRAGCGFVGTTRWASINALHGREQSRKDDMESLGYILIYFVNGRLPWQGTKERTKERRIEKVRQLKESLRIVELCAGCPEEFQLYFHHCRQLRFKDRPNYQYLRQLFIDLFKKLHLTDDNIMDWHNLDRSTYE